MRTCRTRLTRRVADRILDHRGSGDDALTGLIDDAAAPAAAAAGEEPAVALFREATRLGPVPISEGATAMTRMTRRLAALPVAALAAGGLALSGGGLALAASQGAVHVPFTGHDNRSDNAPAAPSSTNPGLSGSAGPGSASTHAPSATPSPSLKGLCTAYQAGAVPRKDTNPAFAALRTAAGGAEGVSAFCEELIGPASKPAHPTQAASPTIPPKPSQAVTPPVPKPSQAVTPSVPAHPQRAAN
jgi:hypothetical protein